MKSKNLVRIVPLVLGLIGVLVMNRPEAKAEPKQEHSVVILLSEAYGNQTHVYTVSAAGPVPQINIGDNTAQAVKSLLDNGFVPTGKGDWFELMFIR